MKRFSSLSFQLFALLGSAMLMMFLLFMASLFHNFQIRELSSVMRKETGFLNAVKEVRYHFGFARKEEKNWILFKNPVYLQSRKKSLARSQGFLVDLKKENKSPELIEMLESIESHLLHYVVLGEELAGLEGVREVEAFTKKAKALDKALIEQTTTLTNLLLKKISALQAQIGQTNQTFFVRYLFLLILILSLFAVTGLFWIGRFRRQLQQLIKTTQQLALGSYVPLATPPYFDELGVLASHFNEMAAKIKDREEKINQFSQELIHANNLLKKQATPLHQIPKIKF